jgi:hypothetical protein
VKKSIPQMLFKAIFVVTIFFCAGCGSNKQLTLSACLTAEEKADLEYFFRLLIFENYGAFVLFGSKPLCEMHLSDEEVTETEPAFQKWLASLSDDKREEFEAMTNKIRNRGTEAPEPERNPYRGWLALEKVREDLKIKNHLAKGLLFGFGLKNSMFFHWNLLHSNVQQALASNGYAEDVLEYLQSHRFELSAASVKFRRGSLSNFTIPVFRTIVGDDTAEKYKKEKAAIERMYQRQNEVEVTLGRLAGL